MDARHDGFNDAVSRVPNISDSARLALSLSTDRAGIVGDLSLLNTRQVLELGICCLTITATSTGAAAMRAQTILTANFPALTDAVSRAACPLYHTAPYWAEFRLACQIMQESGAPDLPTYERVAFNIRPFKNFEGTLDENAVAAAKVFLAPTRVTGASITQVDTLSLLLVCANPQLHQDLRVAALTRLAECDPMAVIGSPKFWLAVAEARERVASTDNQTEHLLERALLKWTVENVLVLPSLKDLRACQSKGWSASVGEVTEALRRTCEPAFIARAELIDAVHVWRQAKDDPEASIAAEAEVTHQWRTARDLVRQQLMCGNTSRNGVEWATGFAVVKTADEVRIQCTQPFPIRHLGIGIPAAPAEPEFGRTHEHTMYLRALEQRRIAEYRIAMAQFCEEWGFDVDFSALVDPDSIEIPEEPSATVKSDAHLEFDLYAFRPTVQYLEELTVAGDSLSCVAELRLPLVRALTIPYATPNDAPVHIDWLGQIETLRLKHTTSLGILGTSPDLGNIKTFQLADVDECYAVTSVMRRYGLHGVESLTITRYPGPAELSRLLSQPGLTRLDLPLNREDHRGSVNGTEKVAPIGSLRISTDDTAVLQGFNHLPWRELRDLEITSKSGRASEIKAWLETLEPGQLRTLQIHSPDFTKQDVADILRLPCCSAIKSLGVSAKSVHETMAALSELPNPPPLCSLLLIRQNMDHNPVSADEQIRMLDRLVSGPVFCFETHFHIHSDFAKQTIDQGETTVSLGGAEYQAFGSAWMPARDTGCRIFLRRRSDTVE